MEREKASFAAFIVICSKLKSNIEIVHNNICVFHLIIHLFIISSFNAKTFFSVYCTPIVVRSKIAFLILRLFFDFVSVSFIIIIKILFSGKNGVLDYRSHTSIVINNMRMHTMFVDHHFSKDSAAQ